MLCAPSHYSDSRESPGTDAAAHSLLSQLRESRNLGRLRESTGLHTMARLTFTGNSRLR